MSWETFNVNDVDLSPKPIPPDKYTLQLLGAFENRFNPGTTDVVFAITGDTAEAGKRVRLELPDVEEQAWSGNVYALLVQSLGAEVQPYMHPKEALTQIAVNGHSRITARVYTEKYPKKDGTEGFRDRIATRSIRPAA